MRDANYATDLCLAALHLATSLHCGDINGIRSVILSRRTQYFRHPPAMQSQQ